MPSVASFWFQLCVSSIVSALSGLCHGRPCLSMALPNDFSSLTKAQNPPSKRLRSTVGDKGEERVYLKVFETLPPQCLNAYGEHKISKMTDKALWEHMRKPLTSGAQ